MEAVRGTVLEDRSIASRHLMCGHGEYNIYLPADYKTSGRKYPVLYLLHGMIDNHLAWCRKGNLARAMDQAVEKGLLPPMIVVMPKGYNSFYVNGMGLFDGRPGHDYESFFIHELVPHIQSSYPVAPGRENTAIAGNSMGGYGACYYALNYPQMFCLCYTISAALGGGNWTGLTKKVPSMVEMLCSKAYGPHNYSSLPRFYMDCGRTDIVCRRFNERTHRKLDAMGFPHSYSRNKGGHSWKYWRAALERMIKVLSADMF